MKPRSSKSDSAAAASVKAKAPIKKRQDETISTANGLCPVVAIGASAGGLEAYQEIFHALPPDTGMAFVLVQHLDPSHRSLLTGIIGKATSMTVEEVKAGAKIRPNRVYVIPPNKLMGVAEGAFTLQSRSKEPGQHLAVNFFMRALAEERGSRAIGVILSGTGADGTLGVAAIKAEGGIVFAQEPTTAKYDGMPASAIAGGSVDFVLPPSGIARELCRIKGHPYVVEAKAVTPLEPSAAGKSDLSTIFDLLRKVSGADFSLYKPNTIHRRSLRRMMILKLDSLAGYVQYLKAHRDEVEKLYEDILIPVTSFFRDFEAFERLKSHIYPEIVKDSREGKGSIRIWAPGCSTGEETYSLAMTLLEFLGDRAPSFHIQLFGTDLNDKGIAKARAGVYRESIAEEISPERLRRFFSKVEEGYRIAKAVRDMCVFARQNLAYDPPFSQMDLVACRNLLIYMGPALQKKVIPILHYALKSDGFLVLGSSESVAAFPSLFTTVDKKHKIYAKKATASRLHYDFSPAAPATARGEEPNGSAARKDAPAADMQIEADRLVLKNYAPAGVIINSEMEVVQFRGRTAPYLEVAPGKPSLNLLKMARNGLAFELRLLITAAKRKHAAVKKNNVLLDDNGLKKAINLSVSPLDSSGPASHASSHERHFLVLFENAPPNLSPDGLRTTGTNVSVEKNREVKRLKQELADAQNSLYAAIESEQAVREEFQSANEEVQSANEELQSSNEELETSKEELQSANEELNTLNDELRHKNTDLNTLNNDISNLLSSTRIPVVMLDREFRIRRLTPNAAKMLKAVPFDIGRPVADIRLNIHIEMPELEQMIVQVLDGLQPVERMVRDIEDHWWSLLIYPYKTLDNKIDGVVLLLQDVDRIKSANEQLKRSSEFFRGMLDTVREPLLALDSNLRIVAANQPFYTNFKITAQQTVNKFLYRIGDEQWNIPKLRARLEEVIPKSHVVKDFEVEHDFESIGHRTMLLNACKLQQIEERNPMILLAIEDITERKRAERAIASLAAIVESSDDAIIGKDLTGVIASWNKSAESLFGYTAQEAIGQSITMLIPPDRLHEEIEILEQLRRGERVEHFETVRVHKDGSLLEISLTISPIRDARGEVIGASKIAHDISARKRAENVALDLQQRLEQQARTYHTTLSSIPDFAYSFDHEGRFLYVNQPLLDLWGLKLEDALGKNFYDLEYPEELAARLQQQIQHVFQTKKQLTDETPYTNHEGRTGYYEYIFSPVIGPDGGVEQVVGSTRVLTERKRSETALIKAEKLAAAGRLAATLAHEINNPLQAITNLMSLLRHSAKLDAQDQLYTDMAEKELHRVVHLVRQSLGFYRESMFPTSMNAGEVLDGILHLYGTLIEAKRISIKKEYLLEGAPVLHGYPDMLRQVFTTLLLNAIDAIDAGGTIRIRASRSLGWRKAGDWRKPGRKNPKVPGLRITVADNGRGISAGDLERIFDPFFTTKGEKGTGLGLWVAQGIVASAGGSIRVRSKLQPGNSGTCFSIFFPSQIAKRD